MYRTIAAVMVAATLASTAGAQTALPPGIPAANPSSQAADAFSLEKALLQTFGTAERHRAFVGIRPLC